MPYLGNLNALRDWGCKRLCGNAMENAATNEPRDFVIATGRQEVLGHLLNCQPRNLDGIRS